MRRLSSARRALPPSQRSGIRVGYLAPRARNARGFEVRKIRQPRGTLEDRPNPAPQAEPPHNPALATIAIYKFVKATLSVLSAIIAWRLMNPHVDAEMRKWAESLPIGFSEHLVREALAQVSGIPAFRWRQLGLVSLAYASVFTLEGVGLWRERRS